MIRSGLYWLHRLANPPVFVVTITGGVARRTKGQVPAQWIADCSAIAADFDIDRGRIEGVRTFRGVALRFSPHVRASSHQRFRNVFSVHLSGKG